ncbi:MAG: VOC family protein [Pirellulaceae bacterium]|jgi:catechol 2,3-dioxygenase-like lactoylglutathione lyase family enzyme|nr:VOC family protein [Pirellulaceae bacterium]MDP7020681.1 VOC family protein [Pirellulaceae bacterium]
MLRHIAGLAEIVEDVNEALAFYRDVLGLTVEKQDGDDYAMLSVPGVLHFGIWNRGHAAESVFGGREHADRIPLGFTLEFEADDIQDAAQCIADAGGDIAQGPREEPWGQKTFRMLSPGGGLLGFAETPWARNISQQLEIGDKDQ